MLVKAVHHYAKVHDNPASVAHATWRVPDLCQAYDWPQHLIGTGWIAIIELGGGYHQADVDAAFAMMNLPAPKITNVSVDGTNNSPGSDADGEVALDIQVAGASFSYATGKQADIRLYWAQDITAAIEKAMQDGCRVCSISWGADEAQWGLAAARALEHAARQAVQSGMAVFAAAGDNDSADGGPGAHNVDLPGSAPSVICCGGTSKPRTGDEVVWNNSPPNQTDGSGTGGGYSVYFERQSWEVIGGFPVPPASLTHLGHMVPLLAANADPNTGYRIILDGSEQVIGGTSAVAPLMAGLFAALGPRYTADAPTMVRHSDAFVDIQFGNNGFWDAKVGPDPCSGIGRPDGGKLAGVFI